MNQQNILTQLIDYREGNLTNTQIKVVEEKLENSKEWRDALTELAFLDELMESTPIEQPTANGKHRFEQLLFSKKEATPIVPISKNNQHRSLRLSQVLQIAAAFALLIMGIGIGSQWKNNHAQQAEIVALKAEMLEQKKLLALSLLEQNSASDRIKGVNISLKETNMDDQILTALIDCMNVDKNINVQLKAIEGIAQFKDSPKVITAFIKTLNGQKSPEVQIAIIEALVALQAKEAYPKLQEILRDKEVIDAVKNSAASGLEILL